jgi:CRP-like cAMP-binding protein
MEKYFSILKKTPLFAGISEPDLQTLLHRLSAEKVSFEKNDFIFTMGDAVTSIGMVLSGGVHVLHDDFWGRRTILAHVKPCELFGEAFSCAGADHLPVSVIAAEKSDILLVDYKKIVTTCSPSCTFHAVLIKNMMQILAQKNILLTQKIEHITRRTTREKLLSYLSLQAQQANTNHFEIPFNRQELAEYLSVDRSAMSYELCKLRDDGILKFNRSHFEFLKT